jgi:hypothetical protein
MSGHRDSAALAVLKDGSVLVAGGWADSAVSSTELFNPATGFFTAAPAMAEPRAEAPAAVLMDGSVLICGGFTGGTVILDSVEIYGTGVGASGSSPAPAGGSPSPSASPKAWRAAAQG